MATIAPLGLLLALPQGRTGIAVLSVLIVAALDVLVALALLPLLARGGALLAQVATGMRIAYAAAFAVAAGFLPDPADPQRFQAIWDGALLLFGVRLILVAVTAWRGGVVPIWIAALLGVAGIAYAVDTMATALLPDAGVSIVAFTFFGEIVFAIWLIARGIRPARRGGAFW